jgi:hypothetical protein
MRVDMSIMSWIRAVWIAVIGGLIAPAMVRADFVYPDFSSTAGLQINGNAAQVGNVLRLTPAAFNQSGSAFSTGLVSLGVGNSFSTYFQFQITGSGGIGDLDGAGADGLVFVVQTQANNVGSSGGGIGYGGISPSVGVEFDTFNNGELFGDNHVGINLNGSLSSVVSAPGGTPRFNDGGIWNAWVDYDGTTLEVRWGTTNVRPGASMLSLAVNLAAVLAQPNAFIGFTSGTGSGFGNHDILTWEFRDEFAPVDPNEPPGVPEPTSLAIVGMGLLSLAGARMRSRRQVA